MPKRILTITNQVKYLMFANMQHLNTFISAPQIIKLMWPVRGLNQQYFILILHCSKYSPLHTMFAKYDHHKIFFYRSQIFKKCNISKVGIYVKTFRHLKY